MDKGTLPLYVKRCHWFTIFIRFISGTYSVTTTDINGCTTTKSVEIVCDSEDVDDYVINTLCEQEFITNSQGKRGFYEMLNEGS